MKTFIKNWIGGTLLILGYVISVETEVSIPVAFLLSAPGWILLLNWNN